MNLTLENCADFVRSSTPEAVKAAVMELYQVEYEAKQALQQKCKAYFASKDERFKRIAEQIERISEQRQAVEAEKARHNQALVNATLAGDAGTVAAIQGKLSGCESDLASFTAQLEMFRRYELDGDPTLYAEIEEDHTAVQELISTNVQIRDAMFQVTEEIKNRWASAVFDPDRRGVARPWEYREPWQADFDKVQEAHRKTPETVGAQIDKKQAAIEAAEQRRRDAAQQPGNVVYTEHTTVVRRPKR